MGDDRSKYDWTAEFINDALSRLDVRLVAHVFQRPLYGSFQSLLEIGATWHKEMLAEASPKTHDAFAKCPPVWSKALKDAQANISGPKNKKDTPNANVGAAVSLS